MVCAIVAGLVATVLMAIVRVGGERGEREGRARGGDDGRNHHDAAGRPNQYAYGKMVVRNGWYVWRVKNAKPSFRAQLKWHAITLLLTGIRATNVVTTSKRKEAFTETIGRVVGWVSLFWNSPRV